MANPKHLSQTERSLPIALLRTREAVMGRFRPMLAQHDVTEQQWRVLRVLHETGSLDATHLAERACVLGPSLSRILKTLSARGFIETTRDAHDGRKSRVCLTDPGTEFLQQLTPLSTQAYADIETRIGKARIEALLDDLAFICDHLDAD